MKESDREILSEFTSAIKEALNVTERVARLENESLNQGNAINRLLGSVSKLHTRINHLVLAAGIGAIGLLCNLLIQMLDKN